MKDNYFSRRFCDEKGMKVKMEKVREKITLKQWHILIIVIGIAFVSLAGFHENIWFDEAYSVGIARQTFSEIWTIGGNDVHPVLYYWFLHIIYLITGGSILAYRIFSIIPIAILIILGYTHIRKDFGEKEGLIFSFLAAFIPEMSFFAVEIRMYSWAMLMVTILAIYAYRLVKKDSTKNWLIFGISSLFCIYLHYYGLMAAGLINLSLLIYLIIKKRKIGIKYIISFGVVQIIAYLPWIVCLARQMHNVSGGFWIQFTFPNTVMELLSSQLAGYVGTTNGLKGLILPTVFALGIYIYLIYKVYKYSKQKKDVKPFIWSAGIYLAVIGAAYLITIIMGSAILYYRYLFVITGLYIFAISFILGKEENKVIVGAILAVIAIMGIYNNVEIMKDNYSSSNIEPINYMKENVQEADTIIFPNFGPGSIVAIHFEENQVYFYNEENWGVEEAYRAFEPNFEVKVTKDFIEGCSDRVWYVENAWDNGVEKIFADTDYKIISEKVFYTGYHDYSYKITLMEK